MTPRDDNYQPELHIVGSILDSRDASHSICYDGSSFYEDYKDKSLPLYFKHYKLSSQLHILPATMKCYASYAAECDFTFSEFKAY